MQVTGKRGDFVRHYVAGKKGVRGNATKSAQAAGYSAKTARAQGARLLTKADVKAAITAHHEKADKKVEQQLVDWKLEIPACRDTLVEVRDGKIKRGAAVRIQAADKILDRALGKATTKVDLGAGGELVKSITVKFVKAGAT